MKRLRPGDVIFYKDFVWGPVVGIVHRRNGILVPLQTRHDILTSNMEHDVIGVPVFWSDETWTGEEAYLDDDYEYIGNKNDSHFDYLKLTFALRTGISIPGL